MKPPLPMPGQPLAWMPSPYRNCAVKPKASGLGYKALSCLSQRRSTLPSIFVIDMGCTSIYSTNWHWPLSSVRYCYRSRSVIARSNSVFVYRIREMQLAVSPWLGRQPVCLGGVRLACKQPLIEARIPSALALGVRQESKSGPVNIDERGLSPL
jgi:hypothetical protein